MKAQISEIAHGEARYKRRTSSRHSSYGARATGAPDNIPDVIPRS
jgi:hypothetical protein